MAKALGKPVYVAAESYKFARIYPLSQRDFPCEEEDVVFHINDDSGISIESEKFTRWLENVPVVNPSRDYTPPQSITLLFTDLGVLTPSAVSDELIQLYL